MTVGGFEAQLRVAKRAATDGFVASKLEVVEWPRRRESMDKLTEDYGEAWRACSSETRGALAKRRETPRPQCAHG